MAAPWGSIAKKCTAIPDRQRSKIKQRSPIASQACAVVCLLPPHVAWAKDSLQGDCDNLLQPVKSEPSGGADAAAAHGQGAPTAS